MVALSGCRSTRGATACRNAVLWSPSNLPGDECKGTVGKPLAHVEVMVGPDHHILVRGNTHLGYLGDQPEGDEWLDTGDLGHLSPGGFLTVNGRAKNLLITSFGRNISPEWLESELIQADLPTLISGSFTIFMNLSVICSTSSIMPGEFHMAFFDRLQQETAETRRHVTGGQGDCRGALQP